MDGAFGVPALRKPNPINIKSLREQIYDYLREAMNQGELAPGATINLNQISGELGISKTPLRGALLQLEAEGFVTILPRRGCVVKALTRDEIRNLYQVVGALESSVILTERHKLTPETLARMRSLNNEMRTALDKDDFDRYYAANLEMHNCYLSLSSNDRLQRIVNTMKQRLYDFPRKKGFVKQWEVASTGEHEHFIRLLESGDIEAAAAYVRDVHWSYEVQKPFIDQYYRTELMAMTKT
ncbi:MAG: GntR family transcriptional regulator [Acidobacteriota bacterium]